MKYTSSKTYNNIGPVAYRQWRAESHCRFIHGYALSFHFEFESDTLDARNWVIDFGGLRPLKDFLEDQFDHTLLVASDDPDYEHFMKLDELKLAQVREFDAVGCEAIAQALYEYVNTIFLKTYGAEADVWCTRVEVRETPSNMAMVTGTHGDIE